VRRWELAGICVGVFVGWWLAGPGSSTVVALLAGVTGGWVGGWGVRLLVAVAGGGRDRSVRSRVRVRSRDEKGV
jgi:hypothetical protein